MHLEPVYLVAPEPEPKAIPTRRAWLFASGSFVTGALSGTVGAGIFTGGTRDGAVAAAGSAPDWIRIVSNKSGRATIPLPNLPGFILSLATHKQLASSSGNQARLKSGGGSNAPRAGYVL